MFKICGFKEHHSEPFSYYPVTTSEVCVLGEVMKRNGDLLTTADADTDGTQEFVMVGGVTGDGATRVACMRITRNQEWEIDADNVLGTAVVGSTYELNSDKDGITNTTTKGVFTVNKVLASGNVQGNFKTAFDR